MKNCFFSFPKLLIIFLINVYRLCISPLFPPVCRFYPSCSNYALQAISSYGFLKGCYMTIKRLLRCNPWNSGGFDPVPCRKKGT